MEVKLYELGTLWKNPSKLHFTSALSNNFLDRLWAHPPLHPLSSLSNADTPRRTISNHFAKIQHCLVQEGEIWKSNGTLRKNPSNYLLHMTLLL